MKLNLQQLTDKLDFIVEMYKYSTLRLAKILQDVWMRIINNRQDTHFIIVIIAMIIIFFSTVFIIIAHSEMNAQGNIICRHYGDFEEYRGNGFLKLKSVDCCKNVIENNTFYRNCINIKSRD
jgi:hypothetical protein